MNGFDQVSRPAIVSREDILARVDCFLQLREEGASPVWTADPKAATTFASMRDAMRVAARLPAALRAYGVPQPAADLIPPCYH